MDNVQLGVVQPQNIQKAASLGAAAVNNRNQASKAQAMARHPAGAGRSAEFHQQAKMHLNAATSNESRLQGMVGPSSSMPYTGSQDTSLAQYS